jgi:outer membrane protein
MDNECVSPNFFKTPYPFSILKFSIYFKPPYKKTTAYNMKQIFLLFCLLGFGTLGFAQRYAVIDTKYILDKMPEYKDAQKQLDDIAADWQKEIDGLQQELDRMYKDFEAEQVMLSDELKKKREDQLFIKEKTLRDMQRKRFGFEGDLFKKRGELIKPVQDKVYNAVQKLAAARGYDFILDKSEGITVIFADPKLEKSEDVLRELGVKNQ